MHYQKHLGLMSEKKENEGVARILRRLRDELDIAHNDIGDELLQDLIRRTMIRINNLLNQLPMQNENNEDNSNE